MTLDDINYPEKPNDLEAFWMPFTANKGFKQKPRLLTRAKGMHYMTADGREILDGTAGLWCCNAGHGHEKIVAAIKAQAERMDFAPTFQLGHPAAFELANRLVDLAPGDLDHVFFTNSGSESADTALKIALGYHYVRGKGSKTRLIGARARLSRHQFRRHLRGGHRQEPDVLRRPALRRGSYPPHP